MFRPIPDNVHDSETIQQTFLKSIQNAGLWDVIGNKEVFPPTLPGNYIKWERAGINPSVDFPSSFMDILTLPMKIPNEVQSGLIPSTTLFLLPDDYDLFVKVRSLQKSISIKTLPVPKIPQLAPATLSEGGAVR